MREINTDALAEAHYAKYDPAFVTESDEEMERKEHKVLEQITTQFKKILSVLSDEELEILQNDLEALQEYLCDLVEEMRE